MFRQLTDGSVFIFCTLLLTIMFAFRVHQRIGHDTKLASTGANMDGARPAAVICLCKSMTFSMTDIVAVDSQLRTRRCESNEANCVGNLSFFLVSDGLAPSVVDDVNLLSTVANSCDVVSTAIIALCFYARNRWRTAGCHCRLVVCISYV